MMTMENDEHRQESGRSLVNWYVKMVFGWFRDYRIVKMADAQGNKRVGIFIPFIQNGIRWDGVKTKNPVQYLKPIRHAGNGERLYRLVPFISNAYRERKIEEGVICPDDKYPCDTAGLICRDTSSM